MKTNLSIELLEKALLGTMLEENYLIQDAGLRMEMFELQIHRSIFHAMQQIANNRKPVDPLTILTRREPQEVGGANYLATLKSYANVEKFESYLEIVMDSWREREKQRILVLAQTENWPVEKVLETLDSLQGNTILMDTNLTPTLVEQSERPYIEMVNSNLVPVTLPNLKNMIDGFRQGELTIIAGRPSMGKTDVMNHFALTAGEKGFLPIIFSLEMSREMLIDRMIAVCGKINRTKMRNPYHLFSDKQKEQWIHILNELNKKNIQIDDRGGLTVSQMRAQVRRLVHTYPDKKPIVLIDYLQIIYPEEMNGNQTQTNIIGRISSDLKRMAKEFDCPVVCLAQLNRSVEARQNKRPLMSDLRDSGNIEQDADVIILLYRDSYYEHQSNIGDFDDESLNNQPVQRPAKGLEELELIIAKNRNGPTGIVIAHYNKLTGQIKE
ncbi:replicative DNA helicase [Ureibacillus composti]